ncbi:MULTISPECIES: hypothetical protein [Pseudomonadaceae]|nr:MULTISPECIES: hypothetical protein [Pseudomonas]ARS48964.1 hypothetical protein PSMEN_11355 [Pseudomonas mendocina]EJO91673.1 hypothetical protein A471_22138 [Pseudomonas mendocina DLHK]ATH82203.1 hypothetical protein CO724_13960 [Pseudomonas mendocina]MBA4246162.1 hypothetical protein [Pseudomonas sp.]MBF8163717.1 hypothetical protein [Pseudomonas mendocina]
MAKPLHLISYILNNQPHSVEVESDREELTPDQARCYLSALHTFEWPDEFTDVQVTRILHPKKGAPTPAHRVQR